MTEIARKRRMALVSAVIVVILGTQCFASFVNPGRHGWPMVAYPMYRTAHFEGERLDHDFDVYAVFKDGRRVRVDRDVLGMNFWIFYKNIVMPLQAQRAESLQLITDRYCRNGSGSLMRLEAYDRGVAIGRDGPIYGLEPALVGAVTVSCE